MPTEHQVCVSYLRNFAPVQIRVSVVVRCVWSGNHRWRLRCGPRLSDAEHLIGSIFGTGGKVILIIICCSHPHVAANCQSVPCQRIRTLKTYSRWRFAMSGVAQWLACWAQRSVDRNHAPLLFRLLHQSMHRECACSCIAVLSQFFQHANALAWLCMNATWQSFRSTRLPGRARGTI